MSELKRVTIIVHGRVQGVFYRDSTMRKARELGLVGTVRNLPDDTVQIVAQGPTAVLEDLVRWARKGPPAAIVNDLHIDYDTPVAGYTDFIVTY
ncbi:MAG: acylphosphatase [bacterium]|nr:acylphosphatase [bacterium]MDT8366650.1 acylphosphatase [bacterium]